MNNTNSTFFCDWFTTYANDLPDLTNDPEYDLEGFKIDIAIKLTELLRISSISPKKLSEKSKVELSVINGIISHSIDLDLAILFKLFTALNCEFKFDLKPREKSR